MAAQTKMFESITVNILLPKDVDDFLLQGATLEEVLDEEPETLQKFSFFVKHLIV